MHPKEITSVAEIARTGTKHHTDVRISNGISAVVAANRILPKWRLEQVTGRNGDEENAPKVLQKTTTIVLALHGC